MSTFILGNDGSVYRNSWRIRIDPRLEGKLREREATLEELTEILNAIFSRMEQANLAMTDDEALTLAHLVEDRLFGDS